MTLYGPDNQPLRPATEAADSDARWFDTTLEVLREATEQATGSQADIDAGEVRHHNAGQDDGFVVVEWGEPPLMVVLSAAYMTAIGTQEFKANGYAAFAAKTLVDAVEQIDRRRPLPTRVEYEPDAAMPFVMVTWSGSDPVDARRPNLVVTLSATRELLDDMRDDREWEQQRAVRAAGELLDATD